MIQNLCDVMPFKYSIVEDKPESGLMTVEGTCQICDRRNGNGRRYPRGIWERIIANKQSQITERGIRGELDHPGDGKSSLKRASHIVTGLQLQPDGVVTGRFEILNTPDGKTLQEIYRANSPVGISSRGSGSVKEVFDGGERFEEVQSDYEWKTFDFVDDPSVDLAYPKLVSEDRDPNIKEATMADLSGSLKGLMSDFSLITTSIAPGANFDKIEERLVDIEISANRLMTEDVSLKDGVTSLKDNINVARSNIVKVRKSDPTTMEGQQRNLEAAKLVIAELANRLRAHGTMLSEKQVNEAIRMALTHTMKTFPFGQFMKETKSDPKVLQQLQTENADLKRKYEGLMVRYKSAKKLAEAMALVGNGKLVEGYVGHMAESDEYAKEMANSLLECRSVEDVRKRYRNLAKLDESRMPSHLRDIRTNKPGQGTETRVPLSESTNQTVSLTGKLINKLGFK